MSHENHAWMRMPSFPLTRPAILELAGDIMRAEGEVLVRLADQLGATFCAAVESIYATRGCVIVSGMGKAGLIGRKITATFASTGTRAHFLHPAEAIHGDLGCIGQEDVALLLSQSGETGEMLHILPCLANMGIPMILVTGRPRSTMARSADITIDFGTFDEACPLGLAPSTSTTTMLAVGDALALVVSRMRGFRAEDFAKFHPGGSLGRKLSHVEDEMRTLAACRIAHETATTRSVIVACSKPGRRTGAIMLVDDGGRLTGMFTDSDLARLFERHNESALDQPIRNIMTTNPYTVTAGTRLVEAIALMGDRKISELPVIDRQGLPVGLLDVTDIVGSLEEFAQSDPSEITHQQLVPSVRIYGGAANAG